MLETTKGDKRTAERGNLSTEEIESIALLCLYSSASMSPKLAAKQEDPILVRAAAKAIQDEKESLIKNGVLEAIRWKDIPPESRNRILRGFIFVVNKFDADGTFLKAKARYVVNGKTQHDDTYGWTASPVVARPLVYMLLQKSLEWGNLKNMDVPKAFIVVRCLDGKGRRYLGPVKCQRGLCWEKAPCWVCVHTRENPKNLDFRF